MMTLEGLNSLPVAEFVTVLGGVFEHSPWIAERTAAGRPFASRLQLHEAMTAVIALATAEEQLALIRAHPELAGRAAVRGELTRESAGEQRRAGLSDCTREEFDRLQALNAAYSTRFGWPFIVAVKGHTPSTILVEMERRLHHGAATERAAALEQIGRIGGFRLADIVETPLGSEVCAMADTLARYSESEQGLTCSFLTDFHRATADKIREWMLAAGLDTSIDAVGNVIGRLPASQSSKVLITGSHYDTVTNAGRYDGRLGVLLPIAVAARIRRSGIELPYALEIVAFADEEGVRFKSTFLGSRAVAGTFDATTLDLRDSAGITMREAMTNAGLDPGNIGAAARKPGDTLGFIEVHIEQGPVLLSEGQSVGVVTSIAGSTRAMLTVSGIAGHAGTVPMGMRKDAAVAAAEVVLAVEKCCEGVQGLVGTVGQLRVPGGAVNVIPGRCELSLDVRASEDSVRRAAFERIEAACERITERRGIEIDLQRVLEVDAVPCSADMQFRLAESITQVTGMVTPRLLPSGAGHDAMAMAALTRVGMLFVRSGNGGISHHPAESVSEADVDVAGRVLWDFLVNHPG